jgi:hypothetical protein
MELAYTPDLCSATSWLHDLIHEYKFSLSSINALDRLFMVNFLIKWHFYCLISNIGT